MGTENKESCSQRDSAERKGYVRAHRSFNRIWKERDSAEPDILGKILDKDNLNRAYKRVKANKGAPGVDGMTIEAALPWLKEHNHELTERIRRGKYTPSPVRRVEIPKPEVGIRKLGIPTVIDRIIQQAMLQQLMPIYEPLFSDDSFGYRPGRGAKDAIYRIKEYIEQGYTRAVICRKGKHYSPMVNLVRYADDFIITSAEKEVLEREIKPMLVEFLAERGLELSEEKTVITHIDDGFDFLGFNIRKFKGVLLTQPSKKCVKKFLDGIRYTIDSNKSCKQETLIRLLNPKITGWANYYRCGASSKTFQRVDDQIFRKLWKWAKRRHPKKGKPWILKKYFHHYKNRNWRFLVVLNKNGKEDIFPLKLAFETKIMRHKKIVSEANPFDREWREYFEERMTYKMLMSLKGRKSLLYMWNKQERKCPICGQEITAETQWNVREKKVNGQTVRYLVHDKCYKQNR